MRNTMCIRGRLPTRAWKKGSSPPRADKRPAAGLVARGAGRRSPPNHLLSLAHAATLQTAKVQK